MIRKASGRRKAVHFISLGCPKNRVDTEAMLGLLERLGYRHVGDPGEAGAVVVNTCAFLSSAVEESLQELRGLAAKKEECGFRLVAAGCLVQRMGAGLRRQVPGVDTVVGINGCRGIAAAVRYGSRHVPPEPCRYPKSYYLGRRLTTGPGWAYLRIADGCDNGCSYCLIPSIRGSFRSRRLEDIVGEAKSLAGRGVKELNLVAQDTTNYGLDIYGRRSLGRLVKKLDKVDGIEWIRMLYTHPAHWDGGLINDLLECQHVANYLDIPLQHVSDRILGSMGRGVTKKGVKSLLRGLRRESPGLVLRTTLMVGYPGETEREFRELLDFVSGERFDRLGAFAYSAEPGTRAAKMPGQVPEGVKRRRLGLLMERQRGVALSRNRLRLDKKELVMIEGECGDGSGPGEKRGYRFYGRSRGEAPEIDGKIMVSSGRDLLPGEMVDVKLERAWTHDLGGSLIEDAFDA